ncbi:hypothetical protein BV25DRAFT_1826066 [Artomyces pyxidatus]|uniref:Uncharacterized protein n=1 Tax=Artomyces pyxidatus TaxID=48021 RepID=A0ACB8T0Z1_9AGAM|nr:hypothetical protein BV25DRAFT_1826066 [Artomyces pyxidatus]
MSPSTPPSISYHHISIIIIISSISTYVSRGQRAASCGGTILRHIVPYGQMLASGATKRYRGFVPLTQKLDVHCTGAVRTACCPPRAPRPLFLIRDTHPTRLHFPSTPRPLLIRFAMPSYVRRRVGLYYVCPDCVYVASLFICVSVEVMDCMS